MIGYFIAAGDPRVGNLLNPYLWGSDGLARLLKPLKEKDYGPALKLLLIEYYVEGGFSSFFNVTEIKVRNYSSKNKDISVKIPVMRIDFHDRDDLSRRRFLLQTTLEAIELVRSRMERRKLVVDFELLRHDVETIGRRFLQSTSKVEKTLLIKHSVT